MFARVLISACGTIPLPAGVSASVVPVAASKMLEAVANAFDNPRNDLSVGPELR